MQKVLKGLEKKNSKNFSNLAECSRLETVLRRHVGERICDSNSNQRKQRQKNPYLQYNVA